MLKNYPEHALITALLPAMCMSLHRRRNPGMAIHYAVSFICVLSEKGSAMPTISIQDLSRKVKYLTESLTFLSDTVSSAIDGSPGGSVNISTALREDSEQFMSTVKAMGFSLSEQDKELTQDAKNGEVIISRLTLEDWLGGINSRAREMTLLNLKLDNSSVDTQNALTEELVKLATDMEGVPITLPPPTGKARAFYSAMATARTLVGWHAHPYEFQYETLLKGLDKLLPKAAGGEDRYFLQEILGDIRRQAEVVLGRDLNTDSTYGRGYAKWEQDTLKKMGLDKEGSYERRVNRFFEASQLDQHGKPILGLSPADLAKRREDARKSAADAFNFKLEAELPNLGKNLLNSSEYDLLQGRLKERSRRQQSGRFYGSMLSMLAVADEAVYAGSNPDGNSATHWLTAAQYLASAFQVPFSFAMATVEAHSTGKSKREVLNSYLYMSKTKPKDLPVAWRAVDSGVLLPVATPALLKQERVNALIAAAEMSKFNVNSVKETREKFGKNSVFLAADLLSLAVTVNDVAIASKLTTSEYIRSTLRFLTDVSFLASDASGIAFSGSKVVTVGKGLGYAGVGFSFAAALANIAAAWEKNADDPRKRKDDTILAVYNFFSMVATTAASFAFPSAGVMLAMIMPHAAAISQALDLEYVHADLVKSGRTLEAAQVKTMHTIAALDASPIVNWFGVVYRSVLNNADRLAADAVQPWVGEVFQQRMNASLTDMREKLRKTAAEAGVKEFHVLTALNQEIKFSEIPKAGHTNSGISRRTISSWVDFAIKSELDTFNDGSSEMEREGVYWKSDDFLVQESTQWKFEKGVMVPLNFITKKQTGSITFQDDKKYTMSEWHDRVRPANTDKALYLIEKGNVDNPAELVLDNTKSRTNTTYQNADMAGVRIRSGSGDDVFQLGVMPLELDGGEGFNVASLALAKGVVNLDMNKGKNIGLWFGSNLGTTVTGTKGNDHYRSAEGAVDNVFLDDGDDMTVVGAGARVNMGAGDDTTFLTGIPVIVNGGDGEDLVSFQQMAKGIVYRTDVSEERVGAVFTKPFSAKFGHIQNYETFIATEHADQLFIYEGEAIKAWGLGAGDDVVTLGSVSDTTIFLGEGNNTLTSADETERRSYDNVAIHGDDGSDRIDLRLNNSRRLTINGAGGNDEISVEAAFRSSSNKVEIVGGKGDDTIRLKGNVEAMLRFGGSHGTDNIYDDAKREKSLTLVFDGQLKTGDIKTSVMKDGVAKDAAGMTYAWIVEVTGGDTKARVHTYTLPAEILLHTTADSSVNVVDLASLWGGNAANQTATANAQRQANLLLDSMASFGSRSGAGSASSLHVKEAPRVTLAVAA